MATKRTMNEIEKDYKKIRKVVDTKKVTSLKEIAELVNLSEAEVRTSLSKHPRVMDKLLTMLEENRAEIKAQRKAEQEAQELEAQRKAEQKAQELEAQRKAEQKAQELEAQKKTEQKSVIIKADYEKGYVIDTSFTGTEEFRDTISEICSSTAKIILTSITIRELEKMQRFNNLKAMDARYILGLAVADIEHFYNVLIDETQPTPDDCIIKYCAENKERVVLLTADKTMVLKARMYGVEARYYKQRPYNSASTGYLVSTNTNTTISSSTSAPAVSTAKKNTKPTKASTPVVGDTRLYSATLIADKLFITNFETPYKRIIVRSDGIEYSNGVYELKIGDDVFVATDKEEYLTFAHYQVTNIAPENNCILVYSKRIHTTKSISDLPKADYKTFMRDFLRR